MSLLNLLVLVLKLAAWLSKRADQAQLEKALLDEIENINLHAVNRASRARDDVLSGRVQERPDDPHRRD